jgi:cytochrome c biogenesis protein CcdA
MFTYNFGYFEKMALIFLTPIIFGIAVTTLCLAIYSIKKKDKDEKYNYTMNYVSYLLGIIVMACLVAFSISFSLSLHTQVAHITLSKTSTLIYHLSYYLPLIPIVFLVFFIIKFTKNLKKKPKKEEVI